MNKRTELNAELHSRLHPEKELLWRWARFSGGIWTFFGPIVFKEDCAGLVRIPCFLSQTNFRLLPVADYAGDWAAMGSLIEDMNKRGYILGRIRQHPDDDSWSASFRRFGFTQSPNSDTLPHAVALAAKQVLETENIA